MKALLQQIQEELNDFSTPEEKTAALKFVPGITKVYGIRMPVLNEMATFGEAGVTRKDS